MVGRVGVWRKEALLKERLGLVEGREVTGGIQGGMVKASVEVEAQLRDGRPAADAHVSFSFLEEGYALRGLTTDLDERGRLRQDLPEGTWRVRFYEPGLV